MDKIELFKNILKAHNLNLVSLKKDFSNIMEIDLQLRYQLYENYEYQDIEECIISYTLEDSIVNFTDIFDLHWYLINIREDLNDNIKLMIGPFLENSMGEKKICEIMEQAHIPMKCYKDIYEYYNTLPVFSDCKFLEGWLSSIASNFFERPIQVLEDKNDKINLNILPLQSAKINSEVNIAENAIEERYKMEENMLAAVSAGDLTASIDAYNRFRKYKISPRSKDSFRNEQHLLIILNTLLRKSLQITNAIHPLYLDETSTKVAHLINEADSKRELDALPKIVLRKYCILSKNHSMKGYSLIVQKVVTYIDFHYTEDISLNSMAKFTNVTKNYLSALFKKETGETLIGYLHKVRIRRALFLINSTSLPMGIVATLCGYNDLNYFIRTFKKENGMTPKQYSKCLLQ